MKPTKAQRRALLRMVEGETFHTMLGRYVSAFWSPSMETFHVTTAFNLRATPWVERMSPESWSGNRYQITEAGRKAVAE